MDPILIARSLLNGVLFGARTPESRRRREETLDEVFRLFPRLAERQRQLAGTLSGGEQQMTEAPSSAPTSGGDPHGRVAR